MDLLTKDDYTRAHASLLPPGMAWPRALGASLMRLMAAFSRTYASLHLALVTLTRELDPRGTSQLLSEWESFAGLPDKCSLVQGTEAERRAALTAKLTSTGGASANYFIQLAATLGYAGATVTEFPVNRFGRARFGDRFNGRAWRNVWQLNLVAQGSTPLRFGDRFGSRFKESHNTVLECRVVKLKPSHTKVLFQYGG